MLTDWHRHHTNGFSISSQTLFGFPAASMLFLAIAVGLNMGTYSMSLLLLVSDTKGSNE